MSEFLTRKRGRLWCIAAALAVAGCGLEPVVHRAGSEARPAVSPKPAAALPAGTIHVVKRGETLYSIAAERGLDVRDVARWNKLDDPAKISVGQTLRLSPYDEPRVAGATATEAPQVQIGAARGAGPVEARPLDATPSAQPAQNSGASAGGVRTSPKALRLPYSAENVALLSKGGLPPAATVKPAVPDAERGAAGIEFIWPVKGRVLAGYSEPNNRGVDIGGRIGDPIVAAAAGRVMYVGTSIRGYGKLIVIKHDNDFNSVYAHNKEILVKEGQNVARGQKIAELGDTESDKPKLHFEIRKSGKPVDPLRYLPGNNP